MCFHYILNPPRTLVLSEIHSYLMVIEHYTTLTNLSTKYLVMCKVYTDVGGIK